MCVKRGVDPYVCESSYVSTSGVQLTCLRLILLSLKQTVLVFCSSLNETGVSFLFHSLSVEGLT